MYMLKLKLQNGKTILTTIPSPTLNISFIDFLFLKRINSIKSDF